jgi:hypothetical protein
MLVAVIAFQAVAFQTTTLQANKASVPATNFAGRWQVKFAVAGVEKHLIVVSQPRGIASFLLQDTGPEDKPVADPQPAVWSQLTNDRVSFSGEVELPIGTCCREMGTLIFKAKFSSNNLVSGKLIFVTSVEEEENPYKFRSLVGTFTATRVQE